MASDHKTYRRVNIDILGHQYAIKTDGDEQYVQRIADYVNKKSQELMESTQSISTLDIAIKVAINLADELFQEQAAKEALFRSVEEESDRLVDEIEERLQTSST